MTQKLFFIYKVNIYGKNCPCKKCSKHKSYILYSITFSLKGFILDLYGKKFTPLTDWLTKNASEVFISQRKFYVL